MPDERAPLEPTIRNAVIHVNNEQPLLADLFQLPSALDRGLLCTNLRTMNGKRPVFADHVASVFFFPYEYIRFVEIHPSAGVLAAERAAAAGAAEVEPDAEADTDLEIDEDFLRRIREV